MIGATAVIVVILLLAFLAYSVGKGDVKALFRAPFFMFAIEVRGKTERAKVPAPIGPARPGSSARASATEARGRSLPGEARLSRANVDPQVRI